MEGARALVGVARTSTEVCCARHLSRVAGEVGRVSGREGEVAALLVYPNTPIPLLPAEEGAV